MERVVIVGASAAGLGAAETLRHEGYAGSIVMVGDELHPPYDRPPLSKQLLKGMWAPEKVTLRDQTQLAALDLDLVLGSAAVRLDLDDKRVELANGTSLGYDGLVIATGVRARRLLLPGSGSVPHTLRGLDDALALRSALSKATSVAVIGAGFLGSETAAVARELGLEVYLIDVLPAPMMRIVGPVVGHRLADLHRDHGVHLHLGTVITDLWSTPKGTQLMLDDGDRLDVNVVVAAVGSQPNTEWLNGSGLDTSNGVTCDELCLAAPEVVVAGDVARWYHRSLGRHVRVEHRMNATEQSRAAARTLLGIRQAFAPVSYFWTDQFNVKVQAYGPISSDYVFDVVQGDIDSTQFAGLYRDGTRVVGALAWNMPKAARELRQAVVDGFATTES